MHEMSRYRWVLMASAQNSTKIPQWFDLTCRSRGHHCGGRLRVQRRHGAAALCFCHLSDDDVQLTGVNVVFFPQKKGSKGANSGCFLVSDTYHHPENYHKPKSGQISSRPHTTSPQKLACWFREIFENFRGI